MGSRTAGVAGVCTGAFDEADADPATVDEGTAEDTADDTPGFAPGATHLPADGAMNGIPGTSLTVTRSFGPGSGYSSAVPAVLRHSPSAIWPGMFMSPTYIDG